MSKHAQTQKIKTANTFSEEVIQRCALGKQANQTDEDESSRKPGLIRRKQSREVSDGVHGASLENKSMLG